MRVRGDGQAVLRLRWRIRNTFNNTLGTHTLGTHTRNTHYGDGQAVLRLRWSSYVWGFVCMRVRGDGQAVLRLQFQTVGN